MCDFGEWVEWSSGIIAVTSYLYVDTRKDQYRLLNPTHLGLITGYIMEGAVGGGSLKNMLQ